MAQYNCHMWKCLKITRVHVCVYSSDLQIQKKGAVLYEGAHNLDLIKHIIVDNACSAAASHNWKSVCRAILLNGFDYLAIFIGTLVFRGLILAHSFHTRALFDRYQNQLNNRRCLPQIKSWASADIWDSENYPRTVEERTSCRKGKIRPSKLQSKYLFSGRILVCARLDGSHDCHIHIEDWISKHLLCSYNSWHYHHLDYLFPLSTQDLENTETFKSC